MSLHACLPLLNCETSWGQEALFRIHLGIPNTKHGLAHKLGAKNLWWVKSRKTANMHWVLITTCKEHFPWILSLLFTTILGDRYGYFLHFRNDKRPREVINNLPELTVLVTIYLTNLVCLTFKSKLLPTTLYVFCMNHKLFSDKRIIVLKCQNQEF